MGAVRGVAEAPPPLVWKAKECPDVLGCEIADVRRCRKRALEFNVHPIPVVCALDVVRERVGPTLGDLNFLTKKAKSFVLQLGYTGPGWQHRVLTEWLLHTGVISWEISRTPSPRRRTTPRTS